MPAARVISSSLNYASAEVSSSVRIRQVQREGIEESCHTKLIKPCHTSIQSRHIGRPTKRPSVKQQSNKQIFYGNNLEERQKCIAIYNTTTFFYFMPNLVLVCSTIILASFLKREKYAQ